MRRPATFALAIALSVSAATALAQRGALDERHVRVVRVARWESLPSPSGYSLPLAGRVIALVHEGYVTGWGRGSSHVMMHGAYATSLDGSMPFYTYFPTAAGEQASNPYRVTLPDGSPWETPYASMLRPGTPNDVGLSAPAHIAELEVNGGGGSREGHFVATGVRVLDGTPELPLRAGPALLALEARIERIVARERGPFDRALRWGTLDQEVRLVRATWRTSDRMLVASFEWEILVHRDIGRVVREPVPCPPCPCSNGVCAPCVRCEPRDRVYEVREEREVAMGLEHVVDAEGRLVRETLYAPRVRRSEGRRELERGYDPRL